jgi:hypothetical protein
VAVAKEKRSAQTSIYEHDPGVSKWKMLRRYHESIGQSAMKLIPLFVVGLTSCTCVSDIVCLFKGQVKKHIASLLFYPGRAYDHHHPWLSCDLRVVEWLQLLARSCSASHLDHNSALRLDDVGTRSFPPRHRCCQHVAIDSGELSLSVRQPPKANACIQLVSWIVLVLQSPGYMVGRAIGPNILPIQ